MTIAIRDMQAMLKEKGFYQGVIDGIAGKLTVEAVAKALGVEAPKVEPHAKGLTERDYQRLQGVNPILVKLVEALSNRYDKPFFVNEGLRTQERQAQLVKAGKSKTMNSYHLTGHAVDLVPLVNGQASWDWKDYYPLAEAMKAVAKELGINVTWGGDWKKFPDAPHWQIPR